MSRLTSLDILNVSCFPLVASTPTLEPNGNHIICKHNRLVVRIANKNLRQVAGNQWLAVRIDKLA